jgi:hypothetical protein
MSNSSIPNSINLLLTTVGSELPRSEARDTSNESDKKKRITHSVAFKLEVCDYMKSIPNATKSGCARFFNIQRKQVSYFMKHEHLYRDQSHSRIKRNVIRPAQIKMRAKYFTQEQMLFSWFLESRRDGNKHYLNKISSAGKRSRMIRE